MSFDEVNYEDTGFMISSVGCQTYYARKKGKRHIERGLVCQDYCLVENLNDNVLIIAVADGHGGEEYVRSDIGARIACETIANCVSNILKGNSPALTDDTWVKALKRGGFKTGYINQWKKEVLEDYKKNCGDVQESSEANIIRKYGTTILFAVVTKKYYVLGQLGDGAILMFNDAGQCQLFKRHTIKTDSQTSSMASGKAEYAFMIDFFRRELFGNVLISTDGIYDKLDRKDSFLRYAMSLLRQIRDNKSIDNLFEIRGIDVSEISKDDCTVALMVSNELTQRFELKMPPECSYTNIEFVRAYNGFEIYHAQDEEDRLEIHIVDTFSLQEVDIKNCIICKPKGLGSKPVDKRMFSFALPKGLVRLQELIEYDKHLEKKYWFNDREHTQREMNDPYSNEFWMEVYEKMTLIEKEFEIIKVYPLPAMFDTAYIMADRNIFIFPDTLRKDGFSKEKLSSAFNTFYEYFGIMGKLSCGKISLPLFRCAVQGQNINMLHANGMDSSLCRVIYNKDKKIYGLYNLSGRIWNIEDGRRKEIPPQGVLRLKKNHSFTVENVESCMMPGAELVDGFARYRIELF